MRVIFFCRIQIPSGVQFILNNANSNLNVRNSAGKVVAKLKDGAEVYVDQYDGGFARVSLKRRGKLVRLGWVASEYLLCGE